jgi:hypothetical protein
MLLYPSLALIGATKSLNISIKVEDDMSKEEHKQVIIKARPYTLFDKILYKLRLDGVLC